MTGEKILVQRAKKGEMAAFETLVTAYERRVFTLALRSTGSEQDAADITQEVFLRAYRSLDTFRGDSGFSTWLYRITSNLCVDHARSTAAAGIAATLGAEDENGISELPDDNRQHQPEAVLENNELRRELDAALRLLAPNYRRVLVLRDVAGLRYADIANMLDLEEGTVKSRLARARASMRKILLERGNISLPSASKQTERGREDD